MHINHLGQAIFGPEDVGVTIPLGVIERAINPPGRWVDPLTLKTSLEPGSVPDGYVTADECEKAFVMSEKDRSELQVFADSLAEPIRTKLQAMVDRMELL